MRRWMRPISVLSGEAASSGFSGLRSSQGRPSLRPARISNIGSLAGPATPSGRLITGLVVISSQTGVRLDRRDRDRAKLHRLAVLLRPYRRRVVGRIARFAKNGDEVESDRSFPSRSFGLSGRLRVGGCDWRSRASPAWSCPRCSPPIENRVVIGTVLVECGAFDRLGASGDGVNAPLTQTPFAPLARTPL